MSPSRLPAYKRRGSLLRALIRRGSSGRSNTEQILAEVADEAKTAFNAELDFF